MVVIRDLKIHDSEGLIDVNIKTWQSAYKGIINDETLASLDIHRTERIQRFKNEFGSREVDGHPILGGVALKDDEVIGFVTYGKARDNPENLEGLGEIYAIYVLEAYQGQAVGRKLLEHAVKNLLNQNIFKSLIIWTLKDNRSRGFYERLGGVQKYKKTIEISNQTLDEVGYLFKNLDKMLVK